MLILNLHRNSVFSSRDHSISLLVYCPRCFHGLWRGMQEWVTFLMLCYICVHYFLLVITSNYCWPWRSQNHRHPGITDSLCSWRALTHKHLRITDTPGSQTPLTHRHSDPYIPATQWHPLTRHHPRARWHLEPTTPVTPWCTWLCDISDSDNPGSLAPLTQ